MRAVAAAGSATARCDLESNNVLTLNLANSIVTGKISSADAHKQFGDAVVQRTLGNNPPITAMLQFTPQALPVATDREAITIPGVPKRSDAPDPNAKDGEILALLVAVDLTEVHAASDAEMKKLPEPVMAYAKMLHAMHGKHMQDAGALGMKTKIVAVQTPAVRALMDKQAAGLAPIIPLDGAPFSRAYLALMVKGHTEALALIDEKLKVASADAVKGFLTSTRVDIASHLEQAKQLQSGKPAPKPMSTPVPAR